MSVPDEGYSRNVSSVLNLISTFLLNSSVFCCCCCSKLYERLFLVIAGIICIDFECGSYYCGNEFPELGYYYLFVTLPLIQITKPLPYIQCAQDSMLYSHRSVVVSIRVITKLPNSMLTSIHCYCWNSIFFSF